MTKRYTVRAYTGLDRAYGQSHEVRFTRRFADVEQAERFARLSLTLPAVVLADVLHQDCIIRTVQR